jgi:hypothetical protein
MKVTYHGIFRGLAIAFIVAVLPGWATTNRRSSESAPVQCGVARRAKTQAAEPIEKIILAPYGTHSVAGSGILQDKNVI